MEYITCRTSILESGRNVGIAYHDFGYLEVKLSGYGIDIVLLSLASVKRIQQVFTMMWYI